MEGSIFSKLFNRWALPEADSRLDLVFENRFKDYGAYQVRKFFRKSQAIATIAASALAILFASMPFILDALEKEEPKTKVVKIVTDLDDIDSPLEEEEQPEEPPKLEEPEPVAAQQYVTPEINEDATEETVIIPPDDITNTGVQTVEGITDPTLPDPGIGDAGPITTGGDDGPARKVAVKAAFPGGEAAFREFVATEFQYPVRCQDQGINGSVVLRFVVDQKGRVSRISAIEETASCPEFTDEAIRVLKRSPRWIPGQNNGKFVISWREIPIKLTVE